MPLKLTHDLPSTGLEFRESGLLTKLNKIRWFEAVQVNHCLSLWSVVEFRPSFSTFRRGWCGDSFTTWCLRAIRGINLKMEQHFRCVNDPNLHRWMYHCLFLQELVFLLFWNYGPVAQMCQRISETWDKAAKEDWLSGDPQPGDSTSIDTDVDDHVPNHLPHVLPLFLTCTGRCESIWSL